MILRGRYIGNTDQFRRHSVSASSSSPEAPAIVLPLRRSGPRKVLNEMRDQSFAISSRKGAGRFARCAIIAIILLPIRSAVPQGSNDAPAFDVASIHQNTNPNPAWRLMFTSDGLEAKDVTLEYALHEAYGVYNNELWSGGPAWISERRFDISAKFDTSKLTNLTRDQRQAMLRRLLVDRFKLVVHHETKEFPLYALIVVKNGPKFQDTKPEDLRRSGVDGRVMCTHSRGSHPHSQAFRGCSMQDLASFLSFISAIGRPVVDKTGLNGRYSFELAWTPEVAQSTEQLDTSDPGILTALQEELGLKLDSTKGPLDTLVIDQVEMPSEN